MIKLYHTNTLTITDITEYSVYADGGAYGDLPLRDVPENLQIDDTIEAFVYVDGEDEVVATMAKAYAGLGDCAYLEVVSNSDRGTYLNWGLPKDLLLPLSEQVGSLREGGFCVVYIYQDARHRPIASMKLHKHLDEDCGDLKVNDEVDLMIAGKSDLGFKAIINNEQLGLLYHEELSQPLKIGARMKGWVSKIRDDGKINVNINRLNTEARDDLEETILAQLQDNGGRLNLSDKSSPDLIYQRFQVSKKNFKRALGALYKKRLIHISPEFIELIPEKK